MTSRWRSTAALSRALVTAGLGIGGAVLAGEAVLVVLVVPLLLCAAMALASRPTSDPRVLSVLDHVSLHEGQGTTSRLRIEDGEEVEQATRVAAAAAYVAMHPAGGLVSGLLRRSDLDVEVSPRRWGRRRLGVERVGLTSSWAGYRWGPVELVGAEMRVLPQAEHYDSHAESPQPMGLVGSHRSTRPGTGAEFAGIRAFGPGDRLRRINWRVSTRTRQLHVNTSRAEQDTGVLLLVDAMADHGRSAGVDGGASSLDLTVRAAAALAAHAVRQGDRVALRVVGLDGFHLGFGSGRRHLHRLLGMLSGIRAGAMRDGTADRLQLPVTAGTTVLVFSPMLADAVGTTAATMARRGLPTVVIDTLPRDAAPGVTEGADPLHAALAWRLRRLEREQVLSALASLGCPVVPWRGPGTADDVLRRLGRRARLPQVRSR